MVQRLPGLDHGAFSEQTLLHDAVNLRANLGAHKRAGAPGQRAAERLGLGLQRNDADFDGFAATSATAAAAGSRCWRFVRARHQRAAQSECQG